MRSGPGSLGGPRVGIVLLWLLPTAEEDESAAFAEIDPAELEHFEAMTGLDMRDFVARLQRLAVAYRQDPRGTRAEVVLLMNGNEIAAEQILKLLASFWDDGKPAEEAPGGESGEVVSFERGEDADAQSQKDEGEEDGQEDDDGGET